MLYDFQKFDCFVEDRNHGKHDFSRDQLAVALTDSKPDKEQSSISEIDYANVSSRDVKKISSKQVGGEYKLVCADLTLKASGPVQRFQYVVLVNKTKNLPIAFCDRGRPVEMIKTDKCVIGFNGDAGVFRDK
jgi:hypothetical protein